MKLIYGSCFCYQNFPNGAKKTSIPNRYDSVLSAFPSFQVKNYDKTNIGYLSFGGMMAGLLYLELLI